MGRKKPPPGDPKRAIAYLRVSTDRQEHGPEAQRAALTAWAGRGGIQIVEWVEEKESGAATIEERPELQKALAALRTNGAGVFLASKRDRVARDVTIARDIAAHVRTLGAVVITADGMSDTEDRADGRLKQGISDLFAEHERHQIADRTRQGLAVMRARGLRTGKVPYGFQIASQGPLSKKSGRPLPLELHEAEQTVCAYVVRLHEGGASVSHIVDELQDRGFRSRADRALEPKQVRRIIDNCEGLRKLFPEHAGGRLGKILSCGRGHVHEDAREGSYCCRNECAADRGTYEPMRRIEWRKK